MRRRIVWLAIAAFVISLLIVSAAAMLAFWPSTSATSTSASTSASAASVVTVASAGGAGTYVNPVFPNLADPGCIRVGSTYYVSGTQRGGFDVFASGNLRDWTTAAASGNGTGQGGCSQCWAPAFVGIGSKFYMAFTDGSSMTTSIAVADNVTGPYTTVCHGGIPGIDGYLYVHTDGNAYCFYNAIGRGAVMACARLTPDLSAMVATQDLFTGPIAGLGQKQPTVEGPVATLVGSTIFLTYSFNGTGPDYNVSYATSKSPFGPWKQSGVTVFPVDGSGHGGHDIVKTPSGKWAILYHTDQPSFRSLCVDQAFFDEPKLSFSVKYHAPGQPAPLIT